MTIADNVETTRLAQEAVELISALGAEAKLKPEQVLAYWDKVAAVIDVVRGTEAKQEASADKDAMNDEQARRFEATLVPGRFSKHGGSPIGQADIRFLVWVDDESEWNRRLNRYLRSSRGKARQDE